MKPRNLRFGIVTFSIMLMICSALISYSLIRENDDKITNLQFEIKKKQEAIDNVWQSSLSQEAKVDNAILVSLLSKNHKKDYSRVIKHYTQSKADSVDDLVKLLEGVKKDRQDVANIIDSLYGEKIVAESEIMTRSQKNKLYTAITIFLQLISVVLVTISRDLSI